MDHPGNISKFFPGKRTFRSYLLPKFIKQPLKRTRQQFRELTGSFRILPDFLIIGAQRSGTSSLYKYMIQHPCIHAALEKEVDFFTTYFSNDISWYKARFPTNLYRKYFNQFMRGSLLVGEASPYYLSYPHTARRVSQLRPNIKLIAILRNPVDRAYSHYNHVRFLGLEENISFKEALNKEEERIEGELEKLKTDDEYQSYNFRHLGYVARGIYVDQLTAWYKYFEREQIQILNTEEFRANSPQVYSEVLEFLGLSIWYPKNFLSYNALKYPPMEPTIRQQLIDFYRPHNQRLYDLLGRTFNWDR